MKTVIMAFTQNGAYLAKKLADALGADGYVFEKYAVDGLASFKNLTELVNEKFDKSDALVFVSACGIAVRAIAPHIRSKTTDPAVVVVDERSQFAIPILSGHIGGANELAEKIAEFTGARAVITTATDINGKFAVDAFAKKNKLYISDMQTAKLISAEILRGHKIGLYSDLELADIPDCFTKEAELGICISTEGTKKPFVKTLNLIPRNIVLGVGCKKGAVGLTEKARTFLAENGISEKTVLVISSVDLKKDEPSVNALAKSLGVPFETFTVNRLSEQEGDFTASEFVEKAVGVDNVCERSVAAAGAKVTVKKTVRDGVTFALGETDFTIDFNA